MLEPIDDRLIAAVVRYYDSMFPQEADPEARARFRSIMRATIARQLGLKIRQMGLVKAKCTITLFGQGDVSIAACLAEAGLDRRSASYFQRGVTMFIYQDRAYTKNHAGSIKHIFDSFDPRRPSERHRLVLEACQERKPGSLG